MDHRRHDGGPITAIAAIDILHHLLATLVFEIDVDIRRLATIGRDEAGKQQVLVLFRRIDRGDPQAETDTGIGRRTAPLTENSLLAGPADDVVDGEEVVRIFQLLDQIEFMGHQLGHLVRHTVRIAPAGPGPTQIAQVLDGGLARWHGLVRIFVGQLAEIEVDPLGDLDAALYSPRKPGKQSGQLGGGFQVALGIGCQPQARVVDCAVLPDAGQHVLQGPAFRAVIEHVVGGDHRRAGRLGQDGELRQSLQVAGAIAPRRRQPDLGQFAGDAVQVAFEGLVQPLRWDHQHQLAFGVVAKIGPMQLARRLLRPPLAQREQAGEAAIGFAVGRIDQQAGRPVGEIQAAAGQRANLRAALA